MTLPRGAAKRFRTVLKKSLMQGEFRGRWPAVVCHARNGEVALEASQGGLAVRLSLEANGSTGALAFRGDVLPQFGGAEVALDSAAPGRGVARWIDGGVLKAAEFPTVPAEEVRPFPDEPRLTPMPDGFLAAFADAIHTAAMEHVKAALTRVLLRGKGGEVVASDSRQLLVQRGFPFPWEDDLLVPRVPAFVARDLAPDGPAGVGRTTDHVVVRVPPWSFALPIDTANAFPAIEAVIPRAGASASRLQLDPADVQRLIDTLPRLPGGGDEHSPVTLDLGRPPAVRAKADGTPAAAEVVLDRSAAAGPPVRVATDRAHLLRALALGFTEVLVARPDKAVQCRDRRRIYVWMPLDAASVVPPGPAVKRVQPATEPEGVPTGNRRRATFVPAPPANGPAPANGTPKPPPKLGPAGVIAEATAVRGLLRDAGLRLAGLVRALRQQQQQTRAVQQAVHSLRQLQLEQ